MFRDRLERAVVAQADFLARLDVHLRALHAAHVREVQALLSRAVGSLWFFYGESRSRRLRRRAQKIAALGERYQEREALYGTPQDHLRIVTFQRFHAEAVTFARDLRSLDPTAPPAPRRAFADRVLSLSRGVSVVLKRAPYAGRLLVEGFGLLRVAFGSNRGRVLLSLNGWMVSSERWVGCSDFRSKSPGESISKPRSHRKLFVSSPPRIDTV